MSSAITSYSPPYCSPEQRKQMKWGRIPQRRPSARTIVVKTPQNEGKHD